MIVTISTPMYGGNCSGRYARSLLNLVAAMNAKGWRVYYDDLYNESLITRARNTLTEMFLRSDSEVLLFIDADQSFDAQAVVRMLEEDRDMIAAPVPLKKINWDLAKYGLQNDPDNIEKYTGAYNINFLSNDDRAKMKGNESFPVKHAGSGLLAIKRNVFETLKPKLDTYTSLSDIGPIRRGDKITNFWKTEIDPELNILLSEDYFLCKLWSDLGNQIYLAPYVRVSHFGTYEFK